MARIEEGDKVVARRDLDHGVEEGDRGRVVEIRSGFFSGETFEVRFDDGTRLERLTDDDIELY